MNMAPQLQADITPEGGDYDIARNVIEYLTVEYREQPSLEAIAAQLNQSPTQLQKTFTRWAGLSPKAFLQAVTLDHAKRLLRQENLPLLAHALESILKITHPFAPFVTETIWQTLYSNTDSLLITSSWPKIAKADKTEVAAFEELKAIIIETRAILKSLALLHRPNLYFTDAPFIEANSALIARMTGVGNVQQVSSGTGLQLTSTSQNCWLDVDSGTLKAYAEKLGSDIEAQQKLISQLQGRLDNKSYVENAPKAVVDQTKQQLHDAKEDLERFKAEQTRFNG